MSEAMETAVVAEEDLVEVNGEAEQDQSEAMLQTTPAQDLCLESITHVFLTKAHHAYYADMYVNMQRQCLLLMILMQSHLLQLYTLGNQIIEHARMYMVHVHYASAIVHEVWTITIEVFLNMISSPSN